MVDESVKSRLDAAVALQDKGDIQAALRAYNAICPIVKDDAEANFFIGCRLLELKRHDDAIKAFAQAVTVNPDHAAAYNNLGVAFMAKEEMQEGAAAFQRALEIKPDYQDAKGNLAAVYSHVGRLQQQAGNLDQAITLYERSLKLKPDDPRTVASAGAAHVNVGNEVRAFDLLSHAVFLDPEDRSARRALIDMLEKASRLDEAMSTITRARKQIGADAAFDLIEAKVLRRQGNLEAAEQILGNADVSSSTLTTKTNVRMEHGLVLDRLGRTDAAMTAFAVGNSFASERLAAEKYTKQDFLDQVTDMQEFVRAGDFTGWPQSNPKAAHPAPVFMVGFPRSGTTLLDNMLDAHPLCEVLEEKATIVAVHGTMLGSDTQYPDLLHDMEDEKLEGYRKQYWDAVQSFMPLEPGKLVIDKLPLNIIRVPLIKRILPDAKFILSLRHPCACTLSCYMQSFGMNSAMANFLTLPDAANLYGEIMTLWQLCAENLALDVHQVRYEDLTLDFEAETRAILEFIGVEWDDAVLNYRARIEEKGLITTPSYHQITEPIYDRATARWERYRQYLAPHISELEPFLKAFGYEA